MISSIHYVFDVCSRSIIKLKHGTLRSTEFILKKSYKISSESASITGLAFLASSLLLLFFVEHYRIGHSFIEFYIPLSLLLSGILVGPIYGISAGLIVGLFYSFMIGCNLLTLINCILITILLALSGAFGGALKVIIASLFKKISSLHRINADTGLKNRKSALDEISRLKKKNKSPLDVLSLQIKNLDKVRAEHGHEKADNLLSEYAKIMQKRLGAGSHISQLSDDSLVAVHSLNWDSDKYKSLLRELTGEFSSGEGVDVETLAGLFKGHKDHQGYTDRQYLNMSYQNLLKAKQAEDIFHYTQSYPEFDQKSEDGSKNLALRYQAVLNIRSGEYSSLECLICWKNSEEELTPIRNILPKIALSNSIDRCIRTAFTLLFYDMEKWRSDNKNIKVSINITPDDTIYDRTIFHILKTQDAGFIKNINLGFSEKSMSSKKNAKDIIVALKKKGFTVTLYDLDIYRTDVARFSAYQFDSFKLHGRHVESAIDNSDSRIRVESFMKSLSAIAKNITFYGVKSKQVMNYLPKFKAHEAQGRLIGKALPPESIPWERFK